MADHSQNFANQLGQSPQPQQPDPNDRILDFKFSIREATLILNKLNTATFAGFGEASQAMGIFAKVQTTVQAANQPAAGPVPVEPDKTVAFKQPETPATPAQEDPIPSGAPMKEVKKTEPVTEQPQQTAVKDTPPPEDAGVFSVIDKRGDI